MNRPVMLDLCAGQGGASKGYQDAGWIVLAVDLDANALRRDPADGIHVGDIITVLTALILGVQIPFTMRDGSVRWIGLDEIDAIHVSPPCQAYSIATAGNPTARAKHVRLIAASRDLLVQTGKPWVIESVEQARSQLNDPVLLCGRMFGLTARDEDGLMLVLDRHRLFETNVPLMAPAHPKHVIRTATKQRRARWAEGWHVSITGDVGTYLGPEAMGIDWMSGNELCEAIPPAYTEHIGAQLLAHVTQEMAA